MTVGIYKIENKINGHSYIGMSKNIEARFNEHKVRAFNPSKECQKVKPLYLALKKYGVENFNFIILEKCLEEKLKVREVYWIKKLNTYKNRNHYNLTPGGDFPGYKNIKAGEEHGMSILTKEDVVNCRLAYKNGFRSRDVWESGYKDIIKYSSFQAMWHGYNWSHIMPEVFNENPHRSKYGEEDRDYLVNLYLQSGLSISAFSKSEECYVGYGTIYKMINNPEFYSEK